MHFLNETAMFDVILFLCGHITDLDIFPSIIFNFERVEISKTYYMDTAKRQFYRSIPTPKFQVKI